MLGVLIASVIGLIVMYSLNRSLVHIFTQVDRVKQENRRELLFGTISSLLKNEIKCGKTFKNFFDSIVLLNKVYFFEIEDTDIDLNDPDFRKKYSLNEGDSFNYMEARCPACTAYSNGQTQLWTVRIYTQYSNSVQYDETPVNIKLDDISDHNSLSCGGGV